MPNNTINWGQGAVNSISWGQGAINSIGWGAIHVLTYGHDETNLFGLTALILDHQNRVTDDGGTIESIGCIQSLASDYIYTLDVSGLYSARMATLSATLESAACIDEDIADVVSMLDFDSTEDGQISDWTLNQVTLAKAGNVYTITATSSPDEHYVNFDARMVAGRPYEVTGEFFVPSGNTSVDGFRIGLSGGFTGIDAVDTWSTFRRTVVSAAYPLRIYMSDGGVTSAIGSNGDEVLFRNLKIKELT